MAYFFTRLVYSIHTLAHYLVTVPCRRYEALLRTCNIEKYFFIKIIEQYGDKKQCDYIPLMQRTSSPCWKFGKNSFEDKDPTFH